MKYNLSNIMKRMWHLIKKYNMSKSAALKMAWSKAIKGERLAELNKELFLLNMRDLSGGKNNVVARIQIEENNAAIDRVTREINELNRAIYPIVKYTYRCVPTSKYSDKQFTEQLMRGIEIRIGKNAAEKNERYIELSAKLESMYEVYEDVKLDLNAYDEVTAEINSIRTKIA